MVLEGTFSKFLHALHFSSTSVNKSLIMNLIRRRLSPQLMHKFIINESDHDSWLAFEVDIGLMRKIKNLKLFSDFRFFLTI